MSVVHYRFWGEKKTNTTWTVYYLLNNNGGNELPPFPTQNRDISHTEQTYLLRIVYNIETESMTDIRLPTGQQADPWGIQSILFGAGGVPFRSSSITISFGDQKSQ